jgi:hypothetical protein
VGGETPRPTTPSSTQPSPPLTNQQSNPENPSRRREFRRKPVPNHRHLPINPPTAQRERKTYDAAQKQPPPRHRAAAGGGIQRTAGTPPGRPEFRRREDARRPAGRRGIGHQCGGDVREARKGVDGSEKDTYRAGRVVPAAAGGVQSRCGAGARRQGKERGGGKEVGRRSWRGIQRGWLTSTTFVSLSSPLSLSFLSATTRRDDATLIPLSLYRRLPCSARGGGFSLYFSSR